MRAFRSVRRTLLASLLVSLALAFAPPASAGDRVYWANRDSASTTRISFAELDGSAGGDLSTTGATTGQPRGAALDVAAGRVYWTNPTGDRVSFARMDGSGGGDINTSGATVNRPNVAAVYPATGKIYWANEDGDRISFARLDGTGGGGNLTTTGATVNVPIGPAVDPGAGRIYWGNANPENKISYAKLDGSGGANLNTTGATVDNPHGVALDPVAARIYWASLAGNRISYANVDGSGGGNLNTAGAIVNNPAGVAIDPSARKIYWANYAANRISFANLDGSGGGNLTTTGATLNGSMYPALLQAPVGSGAPTVTGGSTAGSVLTCSQGSWAPDLLASNLYRVPQSFAYAWTLNGADVPGAEANTYTATESGDYRCRTTASNPAGSTSQTSAAHAVSPVAYPRPASATPLRVPLVPEFRQCTSPDTIHAPPLALTACSGPSLESEQLKTSTVGRGVAYARLGVIPGNPGTPADEADIGIAASATDVQSSSNGSDYTGELLLRSQLRITDLANGPSGADAATVQDIDFSAPVACTATINPAAGSICNVESSVDTLVPGFAQEGKHTVISTLSVTLTDAGPDGTLVPPSGTCPPTCGSGDERVYLRQGVITP
jgi:DNA-binding beta-propeller fold protein YncE